MSKTEDDDKRVVISNIVKEYSDMVKIIVYHRNYALTLGNSSVHRDLKKKSKRDDSIHRSLRRSKSVIKDIMLSNKFELWCTFTYNCRSCFPKCDNRPCICSPSTCKRFDIAHVNRVLRTWLDNTRRKSSPHLKYLAVPEYHKNGAIHFHALISGFNGRLKDSGKKTKHGQTVYNAPGFYSGFTEFVKIGERFDTLTFDEDYKRVSSYITKYITKDMPMIHGRKRYLVSVGLDRPKVTVNGVSKYRLEKLIWKHKPDYIDRFLEVQHHKKVGTLTRDIQSSFLD